MICAKCKNNINYQEKIDSNKYTLLCKECIKTNKNLIYAANYCNIKFNITSSNLKKIKPVYIKNKNDDNIYYYKWDIIKIKKKLKKEQDKMHRKKEIIETFKMNKLEFNMVGDCYSYIHYGKPDIDIIINNEIDKLKMKNSRRIELANLLNLRNIKLDESILFCKSYIDNGGDVNKTVNKIEMDDNLKNNKNYNNIKNKLGYNKALKIYGHKYNKYNINSNNRSLGVFRFE